MQHLLMVDVLGALAGGLQMGEAHQLSEGRRGWESETSLFFTAEGLIRALVYSVGFSVLQAVTTQ